MEPWMRKMSTNEVMEVKGIEDNADFSNFKGI